VPTTGVTPANLAGESHQIVRAVTHRRNHHNLLLTRTVRRSYPLGNRADTLRGTNRRTAVLSDDEPHV
jgi:hypothetical protein